MAGKQTLIRVYNFVPDWLWPHLKGNKKDPPEYQCHGRIAGSLLDQVERQLDLKGTAQRERIRAVEAKLMALLTLSSISVCGHRSDSYCCRHSRTDRETTNSSITNHHFSHLLCRIATMASLVECYRWTHTTRIQSTVH